MNDTVDLPKPEEAKPKTPSELYQDMIAAKRAYDEKNIYETYLLYQLAKRDYDNYYADKRKTIKAIYGDVSGQRQVFYV